MVGDQEGRAGRRRATPVPAASNDKTTTERQRQARALGDQTRSAIFWYLAAAQRPVRVAELTKHLRLNHTGIRQHLAKLVDADLLIEEFAAPSGAGRPPLQYRVAPPAILFWAGPSPYARLSLLLLDVLKTGRSPRDVGADAGRQVEAAVAGTDPIDVLESEVARWGFEPRRVERKSSIDLVMAQCPFELAALADPDVVCELHLGLAEGIVAAVGDLAVAGLVARDPRSAGCRLKLRLAGSGSGGSL